MGATPINNTSANVDLDVFASAGHEYCTAGHEPDSNLLAGGARVGAPDKLVIREGGAAGLDDTGLSGGQSIA
jgi:hypothetical protein